ncbi:energy transducer TonB [uncultured Microbulbifer sp.]|uniref:energy transducer TonB n=1 Tax=uncultured Microbulbifer sp. TaxID=348147 RepID=UPI00260E1442|nr:energy transducer TonB [uncultured Microbulbifer sp.]
MEQAYPLNSNPLFALSTKATTLVRNGALALGVTGLLLLGMTQLIATDYRAPPEVLPPQVAAIHMPDVKPTVHKAEPIEKPQDVPPLMEPMPVERTIEPGVVPVTIGAPVVAGQKVDATIVSSGPLPIYKPAPRYPRRALAKGLEGYVVVEFTISKNGSVKDPRVVGGYDFSGAPTEVFNQSALNAVERFKYRPTVVEGKPVEKHGVRNRITFKMAE